MRQTLCYIPETLFGFPIFGWGLGVLTIFVVVILTHIYQYSRHRKINDIGSSMALIVFGGAMLVYIIPNIVEPGRGLPIRGYGTCLLIAILAAFSLLLHLAKRQGIVAGKVYSLCFWTVLAGIVGARLLYVTEYWQKMLLDESGQFLPLGSLITSVLNIADGGIVVFGSIFGGVLGAMIFMIRHKMPILRTFDAMAPALMLGIAIGRIGCLLNGCCFGGLAGESSWGITFPPGSPAHIHQIVHGIVPEDSSEALAVYPTQIFSSILALLLCGILLLLGKLRFYQQRNGFVFATFMILYSLGRFFIEFVRTDEDSFFGTGLTISQNFSIVFGLAGVILFVCLCRTPKNCENRAE